MPRKRALKFSDFLLENWEPVSDTDKSGAVADGSLLLPPWSAVDFSVLAFETSVQNETMTPGMVSPASPSRRAHGLYFEAAAINARALPIAAQVLACVGCVIE
jgi:hypothetical protein